MRVIAFLLLTAAVSACTAAGVPAQPAIQTAAPTTPPTPAPTRAPAAKPIVYGYEVVAVYPHDPQAFTQGLVYA
ncbi:MAG: glutaminyl-peptide cyclotransferase, partial [Anaerolineae bacterium]|nr:glutaminyl-peptide cyclotransferase [Anaerolineae bacterium]